MPYNSQWTGPQIDEAIGEVRRKGPDWDAKQNEVIGGVTQIAGFNMMGELVAKSPSDIPDIATKEYVQQVAGSGSGGVGGGAGLPTGGATGQMLVKSSYENYDTEWADPPAVPTKVSDLDNDSGFVTGTQVDNKINQALDDVGASGGLPTGGTTGQYLVKKSTAAYDAEWKDIPDFVTQDTLDSAIDTALDGLNFEDGLPTGGTTGQVLTKKSNTDYDAEWQDPTGGVESFNGRSGAVMPQAGDYTASMVGALPDTTVIPTKVSQLTNDSSYARIWKTTVTLNASDWNTSTKAQTVTINGIKADESAQLIQPVPAKDSYELYADAEIKVTQSANSLTFTAEEIPTENIVCYVVITELDGTSSVPPVSGGDSGSGGTTVPDIPQTDGNYIVFNNLSRFQTPFSINNPNTIKIVMDVMPLEKYAGTQTYLFGSIYSGIYVLCANSSTQMLAQIGYASGAGEENSYGHTFIDYSLPVNERIVVDMDAISKKLSLGSQQFTINTATAGVTGRMYIGIDPDLVTAQTLNMRVYSFKIYESNTLVSNLTPMKNTDGTVGMYDLISNEFVGPASGTLVAGPDVPTMEVSV